MSQRRFHLTDEIFDQWTTNLDFSRALDIGWSSPLETSFGIEYRWEKYELAEGEQLLQLRQLRDPQRSQRRHAPGPGPVLGQRHHPEDAGDMIRHSGAAYVDFGLNITPEWYTAFALRHEKYNQDIGETTSGKFTTRYEFAPGYAVRAAVSNGFRAPSLAQNVFSSTSSVTIFGSGGSTTTARTKQMRPGSPEAIALGAETLEPETSRNYSLGFTAEPTDRLRLTADFYLIDIDDRILQTGVLTGPAVSAILVANGLSPNLSGQYFANAADTRTKGVDLVAEYRQPLDEYGTVRWSLAYNRNKTTIRDLAETPSELSSLGSGYVLFDRQQQTDLTKATPRTSGSSTPTTRWTTGP